MTTDLTAAELKLLGELCDRPVRRGEEDQRRPYQSLRRKRLIRHNATVGSEDRMFWAATTAGRSIIE